MEEVEASPMEEDENVNHIHSQKCRASTSELDRVDSPSGSNDGKLDSTTISLGHF
uniref:Uncharacterized protein n=1 Tax=Physcomitrium patens TaxID=3218 RepID=A0A2K1KBM9_PHYPA|nr:hypothetical protein PHYPA_010365 [Physcomitrium patens]